MQLYLVRHGIAVEGSEGMPDGSRPLTDKGRRRFHKAARTFGKLTRKLDLILTSPLVRAVQTAEIMAGATRHGEVAVLEELDPKFDAASLRAAVATRAGHAQAVALVGHEPQLSLFLAALSGVDPADINFKKGAIVRIDATTLTDSKPVAVRWWLKPKGATQVKGPPLQKQNGTKPVRGKRAGSARAKPQAKRARGKSRPDKAAVEAPIDASSAAAPATVTSQP